MLRFILVLLLFMLAIHSSLSQEWLFYGGDAGGSKYSSLKQINSKTSPS